MSWFVVVCGSSVENSLRYWPKCAFLVKTWVVTPHSHHLEKLTHFVKVLCKSVKNSLRYWPKHAVLVKTWGCYPSFRSSQKVNPSSWRFRANPLRIHWDILTKTCSFSQNMGLLPLIRSSQKVNPTSWRFRANPLRIHWDIDQNMQF